MKTTRGFKSTTKTASTKPTTYEPNLGNVKNSKKVMATVPFPVKARFPKK